MASDAPSVSVSFSNSSRSTRPIFLPRSMKHDLSFLLNETDEDKNRSQSPETIEMTGQPSTNDCSVTRSIANNGLHGIERRNLNAIEDQSSMVHSSSCGATNNPMPETEPIHLPFESFELQTLVNDVPCPDCESFFCNSEAVARHRRYQHNSSVNSFRCDICGSQFKSIRTLRQHNSLHSRTHRSKENEMQGGHVCTVCNAWFQSKRGLAEHMRDHEIVPKGGKYEKIRAKKMKRKGSKSYMCPDRGCNYASAVKACVKRHYEYVHAGIRRFACRFDGCNFKAAAKYDLLRHQHRAHTEQVIVKTGTIPDGNN